MADRKVSSSTDHSVVNSALCREKKKKSCPQCKKLITFQNLHRHMRNLHGFSRMRKPQQETSSFKLQVQEKLKRDERKQKQSVRPPPIKEELIQRAQPQIKEEPIQQAQPQIKEEPIQRTQPQIKEEKIIPAQVAKVTKNGPYICLKCDQKFVLKSKMKIHIRQVHLKREVFKCNECPRVFVSKAGIADHMKVHTNEKPYFCHFCPERFRTKWLWKNHQMDVHKSQRPHKCGFCSKGFKLTSQLRKHLSNCEKAPIESEEEYAPPTTVVHTRKRKCLRQRSRNNVKQEEMNVLKEDDSSDDEEKRLAKWGSWFVPKECVIALKRESFIEEAVKKGRRSILVPSN